MTIAFPPGSCYCKNLYFLNILLYWFILFILCYSLKTLFFKNPNNFINLDHGCFSVVLQEGNITCLWTVLWGTGRSRRGWSCCWMITCVRAASVSDLIITFRVRTWASYEWCWTTAPWPSGRNEPLSTAAGSQSRSPSPGQKTLQRPWVTVLQTEISEGCNIWATLQKMIFFLSIYVLFSSKNI